MKNKNTAYSEKNNKEARATEAQPQSVRFPGKAFKTSSEPNEAGFYTVTMNGREFGVYRSWEQASTLVRFLNGYQMSKNDRRVLAGMNTGGRI